MIAFNEIGKVYADGTVALADISLRIPRGQFCVLLGPSGAGKSTLLRMVNGLAQPTAGTIRVDDRLVEASSLAGLRRRIGMIHQQFHLVPRLSVASNVLSGALPELGVWRALSGWFTPAQRRKACDLLAAVGLEPGHLARRASELSGGQLQRVGIARAFMLDPAVVLADEPVASLDPRISQDVLALLREQSHKQNATVLCSLHQLELARRFGDRIVALRRGRIVFDGTPDALSDDVVAEIYGRTAASDALEAGGDAVAADAFGAAAHAGVLEKAA